MSTSHEPTAYHAWHRAAMKILIVDEGRDRSSVAAARALSARGWTVGVGSWSPANVAARSRAVSGWHYVPHIRNADAGAVETDSFVSGLRDVVMEFGYDTAVATWTAAVAVISRERQALGFPVGYGSHGSVMVVLDKERLAEKANEAGLATPQEMPADELDTGQLDVTVVVKPALQTETSLPAKPCITLAEAVEYRDAIRAAGGRAIVQEMLPGPLTAVSFVFGPGGIITYCQQMATRIWPPGAGITARGITTAVDAGLRERVEQLLNDIGFVGLGQMQFLSGRDGLPRLIDFNPRYYGSLELAVRAGANHPDAWACLALGKDTHPAVARSGVSFQWLSRDVQASVQSRGPRAAVDALAQAPRAVHSIWHVDDPLLTWSYLRLALARRRISIRAALRRIRKLGGSSK